MVRVEPSTSDRRIRIARLTKAAAPSGELLDRRSDELAASLLDPLDERERDRLSTRCAPFSGSSQPRPWRSARLTQARRTRASACARRRGAEPALGSGLRPVGGRLRRAPRDDAAGRLLPDRLPARRARRLRRGQASPRRGRRTSSGCGFPHDPRPGPRPGVFSPSSSSACATAAPRSHGWRRTACSRKRSGCTARPATRRSRRSTTEPFAHHWFEKRL